MPHTSGVRTPPTSSYPRQWLCSVPLVLLFPAPSHAPKLHLRRISKSEAELCWEPLPVEMQNGFITSYTIFWANSVADVASEFCPQHR